MTGVPMTELSKGELSAKLSELERLAYLERALGLARGIAIEIDEELIIARPDERAVTSGLRKRRDRLHHRLAELREEIIEAATSGEVLMAEGEIDRIRLVCRPSLELPTEPGSIIRVLEYDGGLLWPGGDGITAPFEAELVEIEGDEPDDDYTLAWFARLPGRGFWGSPRVNAESIMDFVELELTPKGEG